MKRLILAAALSVTAGGCTAGETTRSEPERPCVAVHAAYDVGSSTTKVTVARVDACEGKVLEVLLDRTEPVGYQEDLSRPPEGELSVAIREQGAEVLLELQAAAREHEPAVEVGVATEAFRAASGGEAFVERLSRETGIELEVIEDRKEAELGFEAAMAALDVPRDAAVVWDIGGGSMQVVAMNPDAQDDDDEDVERYVYYEGRTASVRFRDAIISEIQGRSLDEADSPNPISDAEAAAALELSRELAGELPPALAAKLDKPAARVIGIGGVHYYSIRGQLDTGDARFTRDQVQAMLEQRIGQSDEQIGGDFADTEVSNLILVLGHMKAWNIDQVQPAQITMSDGLLLRAAQRSATDERR